MWAVLKIITEHILLIVTCLTILFYLLTTRKPYNIPPGPRILVPFIGNIPDLFGKDVFSVFKNFREKYGDLVSIYVGSQLIIIVNGYDTIKDALIKKGKWFNGRPKNEVLLGPDKEPGIIFASGESWKEQRKFVINSLQKLALNSSAMEDRILNEVEYFIEELGGNIGDKPFEIKNMIARGVTNVIFGIVAGKHYEYDDDDFLFFQKLVRENTALIGSISVIVNCFPWLRYLPFDPFKMKTPVANAERLKARIFSPICKEHMETFNENNIRDLVDLFIVEIKKNETNPESIFNYRQLLALFGDLVGAGSETTSTTIEWAILYLVNHPTIQEKLRDDINSVVGKDRLPRLRDMEHLPFVEAFILEVIRIASVAPLALPHALDSDTDITFQGYTMPKNCNVIINLQSVFKDPCLFKDPTEFKPERFIDTDGNVQKPVELIPFGLGRRVCAGEMVAKMELFLFISALIQNYKISPPSADAMPALVGELGATYSPKQFFIRILK